MFAIPPVKSVVKSAVRGPVHPELPSTPSAPSFVSGATISGSGTRLIGNALTVSFSVSGFPTPTYTYQWRRGGANISGATSNSYTPVSPADEGASIDVVVTATNSEGSASSTATAVTIETYAAPSNTALPSITGSTDVGATLSCSTGTWDGNPAPTYTFQWRRDGVDISGATSSDYTTTIADEGADVDCVVTATNVEGNASATAAAVTIEDYTAPSNTVAPAITGTTSVGDVLTCSTGTWTGNPTPSYAFQWRRDGVNISGETGSTYTIVSADEGNDVDCVVTATNVMGSASATATAVSIPTSGGGSGSGYDTDADSWFTDVETAGGSFDLSGTNATYTAAYTKDGFDAFVKALKGSPADLEALTASLPASGVTASNIWPSLENIYVFVGRTFTGLAKPLKGSIDPTMYNFVSGAYSSVGTNSGLEGNGSNRYVDTKIGQKSSNNSSLTFYSTEPTANFNLHFWMGSRVAFNNREHLIRAATSELIYRDFPSQTRLINSNYQVTGVATGVSRSGGTEAYRNGTSVDSGSASTRTAETTLDYYLFACDNNGSADFHCNGRATYFSIDNAMTSAEVIYYHWCINALMTYFGANEYTNPS